MMTRKIYLQTVFSFLKNFNFYSEDDINSTVDYYVELIEKDDHKEARKFLEDVKEVCRVRAKYEEEKELLKLTFAKNLFNKILNSMEY